MFRKLTLALATAASLGVMALSPTAASAKPLIWNPHPHHHHHWHSGFGIGFISGGYEGCYVTRTVLTPFGYRLRTVNICAF